MSTVIVFDPPRFDNALEIAGLTLTILVIPLVAAHLFVITRTLYTRQTPFLILFWVMTLLNLVYELTALYSTYIGTNFALTIARTDTISTSVWLLAFVMREIMSIFASVDPSIPNWVPNAVAALLTLIWASTMTPRYFLYIYFVSARENFWMAKWYAYTFLFPLLSVGPQECVFLFALWTLYKSRSHIRAQVIETIRSARAVDPRTRESNALLPAGSPSMKPNRGLWVMLNAKASPAATPRSSATSPSPAASPLPAPSPSPSPSPRRVRRPRSRRSSMSTGSQVTPWFCCYQLSMSAGDAAITGVACNVVLLMACNLVLCFAMNTAAQVAKPPPSAGWRMSQNYFIVGGFSHSLSCIVVWQVIVDLKRLLLAGREIAAGGYSTTTASGMLSSALSGTSSIAPGDTGGGHGHGGSRGGHGISGGGVSTTGHDPIHSHYDGDKDGCAIMVNIADAHTTDSADALPTNVSATTLPGTTSASRLASVASDLNRPALHHGYTSVPSTQNDA
ncbi:hypothetical protein BC831DRAFT_458852 [Entophlyctis helioformis]|nr:hypothetical protein BC831DRAFT_458852 [Entophlyctis helioformis]